MLRNVLPSIFLFLSGALQAARAFEFSVNTATECGNLAVTWSGGTPPFNLLLIPPGGTLRNISIPQSASGSFSTPLLFPRGRPLIVAMSDATGVTAGGISDVLTIGPPTAGATCNTTDPGAEFFFSLGESLVQCGDFLFNAYDRGIQPVTIYGFVPKGQSFTLQPPQGDSFTWKANLTASSRVAFYMTDSQGRNGGVADVLTVDKSSDASCLSASTTSSQTPKPGTKTTSQKPSSTGSSDDANHSDTGEQKSGGSKVGVIIGAVAGAFVVLGASAFVFVFCFKRKRNVKPGQAESKLGDGAPDPPKTYLLPSAYTDSATNLAPSQVAAPYAQDSLTSSASQTPITSSPSTQALLESNPVSPGVESSLNAPNASTASVSATSTRMSEALSATDGSQLSYATNYPPQRTAASAYGYPPQAASMGAAAAAAYGANQYQHHQQQTGGQYPPSQSYPQQYSNQYPQNQQYSQQYPQQYGQQQPYYSQQYPQQYGQQYGQQYPQQYTQQYPQQQYQQHYSQQGYGSAGMYTTNPDPSQDEFNPYTQESPSQYPPHSKPGVPSTGSSSGTRPVVVHTDIADTPDELPPQYSESRAPIEGLPNSSQRANGDRKRRPS